MKKILAIVLALTVMAAGSAAFADSTVGTIMNAGTTQAFTDEPVSEDDLTVILQAGLAAESAINQQPWFFVAITDTEAMKEIAGAGMGFGGAPAGAPGGAPEGMPGGFPGGMPEGMPAGGQMPAAPGGSGAKASLGDSPAAIIIYRNDGTSSPDASFDCGLAAQNMYIAAASLGYGVKIVSSPTMSLNGERHDELCEKFGVDKSLKAEAVLLIGHPDEAVDAATGATTRMSLDDKVSFVR